ncbi:SMI1/KNR4 family protein [Pseudomonas abyssi]|jgi:hypothetical protein|uniref:SMI1/KNR4 family protein n=1 Tax=Pseudomonas abyssi TaxID=170540 RepID=A0A2A3MEA9_9PSED|nr:SMI1/KNR4 family protein [Pseudomonas abyssi]MAC98534.1 SMI1/KNR4 family protein [Pseudomonadales bacterium]PBK03149.1 SMI1/KNR4 family protein [Pseudomonas abyssi]|tara:strand:+ start:439 stop:957 length:519 start_codon:yes stop_codon:yes gene_type:complete
MQVTGQAFPDVLKKLHELEFNYLDGEGIDFEPYTEFLSEEETNEWLSAWTGNPQANTDAYLVFGQDGTGGYAAIWCIRNNADLLSQPIVFFGSEGELGIIASNFSDYLWVLASGYGPYEAVSYLNDGRPKNPEFAYFAEQNSTTPSRSASAIVASAKAEFPGFESSINAMCQ